MASVEYKLLFVVIMFDTVLDRECEHSGHIDGKQTTKEQERLLIKKIPRRMAHTEKDRMFMRRRSIRPWQERSSFRHCRV